jgi:hypothetical protein
MRVAGKLGLRLVGVSAWIIAIVAIVAGLLLAEGSARAQDARAAATPVATTAVHGVVLDAGTKRPIARVLVQDAGPGGGGVLTDNSGQFVLDGVPEGQVNLRFRRPGYLDPYSQEELASQAVSVNDSPGPVTLLLERDSAVHGRVQVPDGDSPDGLTLDLYAAQAVNGWRRWQRSRSQRVHVDGSFAFDGLKAGSYLVHAQGSLDPMPMQTNGVVRSGYAPVWAPGTGEIRGATVYTVRPGQTADARVRVSRVRYQPVTIKLAGAERGGSFEVTGNGFTRWRVSYADEDEALHTELPSGNYEIFGSGSGERGAGGGELTGGLPFEVAGAPVSGLTLQMSAAAAMPVSVETDGPTPAQQGPTVGDGERLYGMQFLPADSPEKQVVYEGIERGEDGVSLEMKRPLAPGRYWVMSQTTGGYLSALTSDGVNLLRNPLLVVAGTTPSFNAVLRQDGGTLQVSLGGELLGRAGEITAIPLDGQSQATTGNVSIGGLGSAGAVLPNLAPGSYLVVVTEARGGVAYREPGVLESLQGDRVEVTAGGTTQATVTHLTTAAAAVAGGN